MAQYLKEFGFDPELIDILETLQIEMVKLQNWVISSQSRVLIILEGRDTAGKGGAVFRLSQFLNPRAMRVVALPKPTELERGQWYFQRYIKELPNPGEIVFFDRSWYNRAIVEPVMGFCSKEQYELFMNQVTDFEKMLINDGVIIFKFWFSISSEVQAFRLEERKTNPLKQWKLSNVDVAAEKKWGDYTFYKEHMFLRTSKSKTPWIIVHANHKEKARIETMKYVLSS
ncbi:MAG: polyphosphate kinase 2, partial [Flavobacteriales bacterium]